MNRFSDELEEAWKQAIEGLKYEECENYLVGFIAMLFEFKLPVDVIADALKIVSSYMKFDIFPADDKYFTEDWSLTDLHWVKSLPADAPLTKGIENEKQFVLFKTHMVTEFPRVFYDIFRRFVIKKESSKSGRKELSDLLSIMKLKQIEIETGIEIGWLNDVYPKYKTGIDTRWLNNVYPALIKFLEIRLNSPTPKPKKGIRGFRLNIKYNEWTSNELIKRLFEGLMEAGLIDPETKLNVFRTIFDSTREIKPVVWIGTNKNQLLYFFWWLYKLEILQKKGGKHVHDWKKMDKCFVTQDNKSWELKKDRAMFDNFEDKEHPGIAEEKKKPIDKIFNDITIFLETQGRRRPHEIVL